MFDQGTSLGPIKFIFSDDTKKMILYKYHLCHRQYRKCLVMIGENKGNYEWLCASIVTYNACMVNKLSKDLQEMESYALRQRLIYPRRFVVAPSNKPRYAKEPMSSEAKGSNCVCKWRVVKPFCLSTDDVYIAQIELSACQEPMHSRKRSPVSATCKFLVFSLTVYTLIIAQ